MGNKVKDSVCTYPKVTIGICIRNCGSIIKEAIDSIIDQDFPHELMEVIFVDDGSEDNTLSIIKSYVSRMDIKVKVFHHEWRGLGATRNVVVNNANGEYIIWVDGDMRLSRPFVRKQVEFMDKNPDVGIGKGKYGMYETSSLVAYLENIRAIIDFLNCEQEALSKPLGTGGSIYMVKAIKEVGGFDEDFKRAGEDVDAEQRIGKAGWLLQTTPAEFYEMRRQNWRTLWKEYFGHGYGGYLTTSRFKPHSVIYKMFPPLAIFTEFSHSCTAYRLVHKKVVFLLPFHWIFKRISWCLGFAESFLRHAESS